jgi:hypothetical protein
MVPKSSLTQLYSTLIGFTLHSARTRSTPPLIRVTFRLAVYRPSLRLGDKPLEAHDQSYFFPTERLRSQSLCNILSDERMGLSLKVKLKVTLRLAVYRQIICLGARPP